MKINVEVDIQLKSFHKLLKIYADMPINYTNSKFLSLFLFTLEQKVQIQ